MTTQNKHAGDGMLMIEYPWDFDVDITGARLAEDLKPMIYELIENQYEFIENQWEEVDSGALDGLKAFIDDELNTCFEPFK